MQVKNKKIILSNQEIMQKNNEPSQVVVVSKNAANTDSAAKLIRYTHQSRSKNNTGLAQDFSYKSGQSQTGSNNDDIQSELIDLYQHHLPQAQKTMHMHNNSSNGPQARPMPVSNNNQRRVLLNKDKSHLNQMSSQALIDQQMSYQQLNGQSKHHVQNYTQSQIAIHEDAAQLAYQQYQANLRGLQGTK